MNFMDLVSRRQSVRGYRDKPVEREKIEKCLQAARLAPSACNAQPWRFVVIDSPDMKDDVAKATFSQLVPMNKFTLTVPAFIVVVSEKPNLTSQIGGMIKNNQFHLIDIGIAVEHICLAAAEQGLGTCILGWFDEKSVKKLLNIPRQKRVELMISIGYPASDEIRPKTRKDLTQIVSFNHYE